MTLASTAHVPPAVDDDTALIQALVRFFGTCNGVVGHEANYQVMLALELERDFPGRVRREYRAASTGRGGIDVAVVDAEGGPWAVFELKGGAYNSRSALKDTYKYGVCKDTAELAKVDIPSHRRWQVAIDAVGEFGRSLPYRAQELAKDSVNSSFVSFAYYGQGDRTCLIAIPGQRTRIPEVTTTLLSGLRVDIPNVLSVPGLTRVFADTRGALEQEADVVSAVYRHLLSQGYSARQVATETYFTFAPKKKDNKMHERPDICLFEPQVEGHFNLYPKGDTSQTYDPLKLANWLVMAEFKGGAVLINEPDSTLIKLYSKDIAKLGKWRRLAGRQSHQRDPKLPPIDFVCVAADLRDRRLDSDLHDELSNQAKREGVRVVCVHLPEADRSTNHDA